jgi:hypothetical protein
MKRESNMEAGGARGLGPRPVQCKAQRSHTTASLSRSPRRLFEEDDPERCSEWLEELLETNRQEKGKKYGLDLRHDPAEGIYQVPLQSATSNVPEPTATGLPMPDLQCFPSSAPALSPSHQRLAARRATAEPQP